MADYKGVLICGECEEQNISATTRELLGIGRQLAKDLGQELAVLLLGNNLSNVGKQAIVYGADKVYLVDAPLLADYHSDSYTTVVSRVCHELAPVVVLLGQTDIGRDLAPRLAARLKTGLFTDCIELKIDPQTRSLIQTCPVYGGNANAVMVQKPFHPQIATVRPKSMPALEPDESRQGQIITLPPGIDASVMRYKVLRKVKEEAKGMKLEDAKVVVAGGRGMGSKEGFDLIWQLAEVLGGAVGATRPPCENSWLPSSSFQIGQSGKIIGPDLYIAVGISGASQHIAGCLGSKNIVAVNKDSEASIFQVANYGIVADYKQVLPQFIQKCRELRGK